MFIDVLVGNDYSNVGVKPLLTTALVINILIINIPINTPNGRNNLALLLMQQLLFPLLDNQYTLFLDTTYNSRAYLYGYLFVSLSSCR